MTASTSEAASVEPRTIVLERAFDAPLFGT